MGPFKNSHGFEHILVIVHYAGKWVEAMPCRDQKRDFPSFRTLRILISD
jgi:hypothetical protein